MCYLTSDYETDSLTHKNVVNRVKDKIQECYIRDEYTDPRPYFKS